jgi:hypothetical protein
MRIENLRIEKEQNTARVAATVIWEDCDRSPQEIFYETDKAFVQDLTCNPHAFLVGSIVPAMRSGERRVAIDETICPELRNGLLTAMGWLCEWYGAPRRPVQIEAKVGVRPPITHAAKRAGSFMSGGIDSLATLRANRLDFPLDHPRSIKDCIIVHGFDIGGLKGADREVEVFDRAVGSLSAMAEDAGITLIPVFTNVRHLYDDVAFWMHEFHGAALSSVAHAFANRLSHMYIASCYAIADQRPWGTHPVLDHNYSSVDLQIRHDSLRLTRLEKARIVAGWDAALQNLRVCWMHPADNLNCGQCDKCIWTMLELLVAGKLAHTSVFPVKDVSPELLEGITIRTDFQASFYQELVEPLIALGRNDLAEIIKTKSADFERYLAWEEERDWKGAVKRFDRRFLGASMFKSYKFIRELAGKGSSN